MYALLNKDQNILAPIVNVKSLRWLALNEIPKKMPEQPMQIKKEKQVKTEK